MPLSKIPKVPDGRKPNFYITMFNDDVDALNQLIKRYNTRVDPEAQFSLLQDIYSITTVFHYRYPQQYLSKCESYRKNINTNLFNELKQALQRLGVSSLRNTLSRYPTRPADNPSSLPEILTNMSPAVVSRWLEILSAGSWFERNALKYVYKDTDPEYAAYQLFIETHEITFLGGKNSKNFKVTSINGSTFVLKVEDRLIGTKVAATWLRQHSLKNILPAIEAERPTTCLINDRLRMARTLLVTEYFEAGTLADHARKFMDDDRARLLSAINTFKKVIIILSDIQRDGCLFPDMKMSNWLLDDQENLRISDDKSFTFMDGEALAEGYLKYLASSKAPFVHSKYMDPKEVLFAAEGSCFDVEKMHVFMLGKLLYQYLTCCPDAILLGKNCASELAFNVPVFRGKFGHYFKSLITQLIVEKPEDRITLQEAMTFLLGIEQQSICLRLLDEIKLLGVGKQDDMLNQIILPLENDIENLESDEAFLAIHQELESALTELRKAEAVVNDLKEIITSYRTRESFYTIGMRAKALRIETALGRVPIDQRSRIASANPGEPGYEVLKALASRRSSGKRPDMGFRSNKIEFSRAAPSFFRFLKKQVDGSSQQVQDVEQYESFVVS